MKKHKDHNAPNTMRNLTSLTCTFVFSVAFGEAAAATCSFSPGSTNTTTSANTCAGDAGTTGANGLPGAAAAAGTGGNGTPATVPGSTGSNGTGGILAGDNVTWTNSSTTISGGTGGMGGTGGAGGAGGSNTAPGGTGGNGAASSSGGTGGTGGDGAFGGAGFTVNNSGTIAGGAGGTGGSSGVGGGAGGRGGNGTTGDGGNGGTGGKGAVGSDGGAGGNGILGGPGFTLINSGIVRGGNGGISGIGANGGTGGAGGTGGVGANGGNGGTGGNGDLSGRGGNGGTGVGSATGDGSFSLTNNAGAIITGGNGGQTRQGGSAQGGTGGAAGTGGVAGQRGLAQGGAGNTGSTGGNAVTSGNGTRIDNSGTLTGGNGGVGGPGGNILSLGTGGTGGNGGSAGQGIGVANSGVAFTLQNNSGGTITGGTGGVGNSGGNSIPVVPVAGGNGGAGGAGVSAGTVGSDLTSAGAIKGGNGGNSTLSTVSGNGGTGGVGVTGAAYTLNQTAGTLSGGNGGNGRTTGGSGGVGILSTGSAILTINGAVAGGLSGTSNGVATNLRANAIQLSGGGNSLTLLAGYSMTGNVVSDSGTTNGGDTLVLGGTADQMFDATQLGAAGSGTGYQGFSHFLKTGTSAWTLTGETAYTTPWTLVQGILSIASDGALGGADATTGALTFGSAEGNAFDRGTLQVTGTTTGARNIVLNGVNGTLAVTADNVYTVTGLISNGTAGPGSLTKSDTGTLVLTAANTYTGGTTISGGILQLGNGVTSGSLVGNILNNSALVINNPTDITLPGVISGSGSLTQQGSGATALSAVNTYTGKTTLSAGTLRTDVVDSIAASNEVAVNGGVFDLNGNNQKVNRLNGTGGEVRLNGATLTVDNATTADNTLFAGDIVDGSAAGSLTKAGDGSLTLSGNTLWTGDTLINGGELVLDGSNGGAQLVSNIIGQDNTALSLRNGATLAGWIDPTDVSIDSTSIWNMTADSLVDDVNLAGTINVVAPSIQPMMAGRTLTATNWNGQDGTVVLNTVLGDDASVTDKIVVNGNTSGNTFLKVNNAGGTGAYTLNGIQVVDVNGQSDGTFTKSGRIVGGAYDYSLEKKGADWYLTNLSVVPPVVPVTPETPVTLPVTPMAEVIRPETASYTANLAAANTMFNTRLHDRLGEPQYTDALTGEKKVTSLWLRQVGGHNRWKDSSGQISTQSNRYVVQLGGDIAQWSPDELQRWHLGVMGGYGHSSSSSRSHVTGYHSNGTVSGYSAGLYATWYENDETKQGLYLDSWAQYGWFNNDVKGQNIQNESYKSSGLTASLEAGYTHKLGEYTGSQGSLNEWYIQPQAQAIWMGVTADDHRESNGTRVSGEGDNNVQTRLGVRTFLKGHNKRDDEENRTFQPFVEVNWIHNTEQYGTRLNGTTFSQTGAQDVGEIRAGVEGQLNPNLNLWGNVGVQVGDKGYSDTAAIVGVKYSF